jgi:hypothetical protein
VTVYLTELHSGGCRADGTQAGHAQCWLANAITPDPLHLVEPVWHCAVEARPREAKGANPNTAHEGGLHRPPAQPWD